MSSMSKRVLITGAAGQIAYSLIPLVCSGQVLGPNQPIDLVLLDIPQAQKVLTGVVMEIDDCAYPLVRSVTATTQVQDAFKAVQVLMWDLRQKKSDFCQDCNSSWRISSWSWNGTKGFNGEKSPDFCSCRTGSE